MGGKMELEIGNLELGLRMCEYENGQLLNE
jgi:hypothetical protein